jgi:hypothetical protein
MFDGNMTSIMSCKNRLRSGNSQKCTDNEVPTTAEEEEHCAEKEGPTSCLPCKGRVIALIETFGKTSLIQHPVFLDDNVLCL